MPFDSSEIDLRMNESAGGGSTWGVCLRVSARGDGRGRLRCELEEQIDNRAGAIEFTHREQNFHRTSSFLMQNQSDPAPPGFT